MSDVEAFVCAQMARFSDVPRHQITPDVRFDELPAWGSLPALQLLAAIESEYAITFEVRDYLAIPTVGDLAGAILTGVSTSQSVQA